jgi:hypothetical protein
MWDESADKFTLGTTSANADSTGNIAITTGTLVASSFEGAVTGDVTGNADTATTLATARNFSLTGDVTAGAVSFDGSGNVELATTIAANSVALGTDTTGNYMSDLTEGTGIDITHTPDEGSNATIALDLTEVGFGGGANRLITDDGDGTVTTESGLTYGGSALNLTGDLKISGYIYDNVNSGNRLDLDDDSDAGQGSQVALYGINHLNLVSDNTDNGTGEIRFWKGAVSDLDSGTNTRLMTINNSGRVGIGTSSPAQKVDISDTRPVLRLTDSSSGTIDTAIGTIEFYSEDTSGNYPAVGASIKAMTESSFGSGHGLAFSTNGDSASPTERMRITDGGNVGIGTGSPSNTLEVKSSSSTPFAIKNASNSTRLQVSLTNDDADIFLYDRNTTLQTALRSEGDSYFNQGNVGIGTTSPLGKLHVSGNAYFTGGNVGVNTTGPRLPLHVASTDGDDDPASASATGAFFVTNSAASYGLHMGVSSDGSGWIQSQSVTSANEYNLNLNPIGGNVGIGTNSPGYKLDVSGDVRFKDTAAGGALISYFHNDSNNGLGLLTYGSTYSGGSVLSVGANGTAYDHSGNVGIDAGSSSTIKFGIGGTEKIQINSDGDFIPAGDGTQDLGSLSKRWGVVHSADLDLSNEGSQNDVDGTWGSYVIQEGEEDLFIINRRNGKKYKFMLQEVQD